jgi:FkbM family methyltransferase
MMKTAIKRFLRKKNLYYALKYSLLFRLYQLLFKPSEIKQEHKEISFYKSFLLACDLIFDIGANDGHKTDAFLNMSKKVVCCEPDSENFKLLKVRFRNKKNRVFIENKAVSDKEGFSEFHIYHPGSAFNTLSSKWMKLLEEDNMKKWNEPIEFTQTQTVATTTLDRLIQKYGVPDFIKIDVEGFEQWVLKGLSQKVAYLSFETLLPDYASEMNNCLSIINNLDGSATYNIALCEKLTLPHFVSKNELEEKSNAHKNSRSFEIIVKMSK